MQNNIQNQYLHNSGLILIDKLSGITSNVQLTKLKNKFRIKKAGHSGTLDKFASGLLLIGINQGTKLLSLLNEFDKEYYAIFRFGITTPSLDPDTKISKKGKIPRLNEIEKILPLFIGEQEQIPPLYSAVKIKGQRASEIIRKKEKFPLLKPKKINIRSIDILKSSLDTINLKITCSKGTYIRSLVRDVALRLGTVGYVVELRRTKIGCFSISDAKKLDDIKDIRDFIIPIEKGIEFLPEIKINIEQQKIALNGGYFDISERNLLKKEYRLMFGRKLVAIIRMIDKKKYRYIRVFN